MRAGLSAFLEACLEPAFRRLVVLDSVGVLKQDVRKGGIEHNELPMLRTVLSPLVDTEPLPGVGVEPLVHVTLGGLYGAALFIARSGEPRTPVARSTPSSTPWSPGCNPASCRMQSIPSSLVDEQRRTVQAAERDVDERLDADPGEGLGVDQRAQHRAQHRQLVVLDAAFPHVLL